MASIRTAVFTATRTATRTACLLLAALPAMAADLSVRLDGVRDGSGHVRVLLFDREEGFRKEAHSIARRDLPAAPGALVARFDGLAPGRYAIMAYHDADDDGALNRFLGMIPTEGYALSNDPVVTGPPAFADSAFDLPQAGAGVVLTMRY